MKWIVMPLRRYAEFSGRSQRKEYWMFFFGQVIFVVGAALILTNYSALPTAEDSDLALSAADIAWVSFGLVMLGLIVPNLAVIVRRLHDISQSGWWVLIYFIPYIGGLILLVLMAMKGVEGENIYGPDPKDEGSVEEMQRIFG